MFHYETGCLNISDHTIMIEEMSLNVYFFFDSIA